MNLDPKLREKLLNESKNPFKGLRRVIWFALTASAGMGLLIMVIRSLSGENILFNDISIQVIAFLVFCTLIILDRPRSSN